MATQVQSRRLHRDSALSVSHAIPAAGSNVTSTAIDIGVGPFHPEGVDFEISIPAMSAHTDTTKNVTVALYDSADNSSFAAVSPAVSFVLAGVATTGTALQTVSLKAPSSVRRYVAINIAETSAGPDLTATSVTFSLLT